ncbi:substrate-binding periplasmic protein [Undibacterium parvum]|uniref:Transporter substrate-binding domain-containing protein n=2 Tax=Undibacterium TaxID=401469 RepID=A0A6M4A3G2_9BURK|nr:transporter substrate-binding domain-containing protein [Undibacterium parvum]AZP10719.1 transporter substrate-binding domain-containing protein [Undibacterium parvum]QJQ05330.1 transporter substrate-binding domain-containing protein [Undibacterium piscinae]
MQRRALLQLAGLTAIGVLPALAQALPAMQISTLSEQDPATSIAELIITEAYRRLGMQVVVRKLPGERALRSANNGEMDGELYRKLGMELDYPNLLIVPIPLLTYEVVIFSHGTNFVVNGWESLRPYTIGYVKSIKIIEKNTVGMKVEVANSLRQAFLKMMLGRSDVVVANRASGLAALKELNLTEIKVLTPPLASFPVFHYLNNKHAALVPKLTTVLQQMQKDKSIENIQKSVMSDLEAYHAVPVDLSEASEASHA